MITHLKEQYPDTDKFNNPLTVMLSCEHFYINAKNIVIDEDLLAKEQNRETVRTQVQERKQEQEQEQVRWRKQLLEERQQE